MDTEGRPGWTSRRQYRLTEDAEREAVKPLTAEPGRGSGLDPRSIVIAPTRMGKGTSFIMSRLLNMVGKGGEDEVVIVLDPKGPMVRT